jgi:ribokinase
MHIVVFGSINMDLVAHAPRIARPGETLFGTDFRTVPGGKGANQAVAVARLGGTVQMLGAVGDDGFGTELNASLASYGVDTRAIVTSPGASGVALILLDAQGENSITVISGANMRLTHMHLDALVHALDGATHLLLQLEIPLELVVAAAQLAKARGITVILDPAPAPATGIPAELYRDCDIITPNETETALLSGVDPIDKAHCQRAADILHTRGSRDVIIKRGAQGVYWSRAGVGTAVAGFVVPVIDTVAAGDCFNGALAVAVSEGNDMPTAVRFAAASAALSVTKSGAQPSMPSRADVTAFLTAYRG